MMPRVLLVNMFHFSYCFVEQSKLLFFLKAEVLLTVKCEENFTHFMKSQSEVCSFLSSL